tara:strand:- start:99 stop:683 length:585 start_codon:yes stop_codon:yes gene_type:complete
MAHKCFISFKTEDIYYKNYIQEHLAVDMIDKSLNEPIDSDNEDYIMRKIREDYLSDSTVTIFLIGQRSSETLGWYEQRFIKRELQASLYNSQISSKSGILGIVLPNVTNNIFGGSGICSECGGTHTYVNINDTTSVKEFSYNYYIPHNKCYWAEEDRYCVLVKWDDFKKEPNKYIDQAFDKRSAPIASKTKVRP